MISCYVRELQRYKQRELISVLSGKKNFKNVSAEEEKKTKDSIAELINHGILKKKSDSDFDDPEYSEEHSENEDEESGEEKYWFKFVGIVVVKDIVIKCYPKYLVSNSKPKEEFQQVIRVLKKYSEDNNKATNNIQMFTDTDENNDDYNPLAIILFLLNDYYENGLYIRSEKIVENNGLGEIIWDKTINGTYPFISNEIPYYFDIWTKKRINKKDDFFKHLHACVLTEVSEELKKVDLLDLFELTDTSLTDEKIEDFGDKEYILYEIEKELNRQFNTRKRLVLNAIYSYISYKESRNENEQISLFGTRSFHQVWENICKAIFDNQLNTQLCLLNLPVPLNDRYKPSDKLINLIEKPFWTASGLTADRTLEPDLITILEKKEKFVFIIFDAKYYNANLKHGEKPTGQPGIESITKQYLYQLAYQEFIKKHSFDRVINCFLMPTENNDVENKGTVKLNFFHKLDADLKDIEVRFLPAGKVYDIYLADEYMNIDELSLY